MSTDSLKELRKNLDQLDIDLIKLIEERAAFAREIWLEKKKEGHESSFAPVREAEIFDRLRKTKLNELDIQALENIFVEIVSACRSVQTSTRVTILGEKQGWVHDAACSRFGFSTEISTTENFEDFISSISAAPGNLGFASVSPHHSIEFLPLVESLFSGKLSICEEFNFSPEFSVVSNSARDLSEAHEICVTSEILQLLRQFFISLSYDLKIKICRSMSECFENLQSINPVAAILPAKLAGSGKDLKLVKTGLRAESFGSARFFTLTSGSSTTWQPGIKTSLICAAKKSCESLSEVVSILKNSNIRISDIFTLPFTGKPWDSLFITEFCVPESREKFDKLLSKIEKKCMLVKNCGFYPVFR